MTELEICWFHGLLTFKERLFARRVVPLAERLAHTGSCVQTITEPCVPVCAFMSSVKCFRKFLDPQSRVL